MSAPVIVSGVKPQQAEQHKPLPVTPYRPANWPFPSCDPAARDAMAREHVAQQRREIVNGERGLF